MNYLTKEDLLDLHTVALERYGGLMGVKSQDRLQNVLSTPHQQMFGAELYPDLCSKTAVMVYLLVKSQPFTGGNQLTALLALLRMLEINGAALNPNVGEGELAWIFRAITHADLDKEGFEKWLRDSIAQPS